MKLLIWSLMSFFPVCFADTASISAFMNATQGDWAGSGQYVREIVGGGCPINVMRTNEIAAWGWQTTNQVTGSCVSTPLDQASFQCDGDVLTLNSTPLTILASSPTQLSYQYMDGAQTIVNMVLISPDQLEITNDIYNTIGQLTDQYQYELQRQY